ncbi:MAG: hypothetical protein HYZ45_09090 [Burkholderiales bacterium]|nr:hypothetical protein [Burkholderiales bacterium]
MQEKIKHLVARTLVAKAFAKKAPIIGAIIASEDVLKKLRAASEDLMNGHPEGAKNELQQAVTHAVGATVNFVGGVSIVGMTAGLVAQTMAQRHADQIAAQKPPHPDTLDDGIIASVVKRAKRASTTAKVVDTVLRASGSSPRTVVTELASAAAEVAANAAMGASKFATKAAQQTASIVADQVGKASRQKKTSATKTAATKPSTTKASSASASKLKEDSASTKPARKSRAKPVECAAAKPAPRSRARKPKAAE